MGVNTRSPMKFVFASLCISIALFQVASATTCTLQQGTYGGTSALGYCTSDYWSSPHEPPRYCTVAQVPKLYCLSGASGTPSAVGLACPADKGPFTGGTFCTLVQVYVKATFTGITKKEFASNAPALRTAIATNLNVAGKLCGSGGNRTCVAGDISVQETNATRRADTTQFIYFATSQTSSGTALNLLVDYMSSATALTKVQAINAVMKKVTLITVLTGHILVNGVPSSASSVFHFSFLATAMSVVAMVYSKL